MIRKLTVWLAPLAVALVPLLRWGEDFRFSRIALLCVAAALAWATRPLGRKPAALAGMLAAGPLIAAISWFANGTSPMGVSAILEMAAWLCVTWVILIDERPGDYALLWILSVAAASVYGITQYLGMFPMPLDAYGKPDPAATFGLSNFAAETLTLTIPLTVAALIRTRSAVLRGSLPAALLAQIVYIVMAGSRAGWLGLAAGAAVALAIWRPGDRRAWVGAALAVLVFIGTFAAVGASRLNLLSSEDPSLAFRREAWTATYHMFKDKPVLGVGPGSFPAHIARYSTDRLLALSARVRRTIAHPHNEFLMTAAERGAPGLAWLLGMLGVAAFVLARRRAAWELGAVAGGAVTAIFSFPLQQAPFWAALAIVAAHGLVVEREESDEDAAQETADLRGAGYRAGVAFLIAGLAAFFAVRAEANNQARQGVHSLELALHERRDETQAEVYRAQANEHLKESIALWPYDAEALVNRAAAATVAADKIAYMRAYLALISGDTMARLTLAQYLADDGQLQSAQETLQALLLEPNAPVEAYHRLLDYLQSDSNFDAAANTGAEGLKKFPGNLQLLIDLGDVYRMKNDHTRALFYYEQAIAKQDKEPELYLRAGLSYMAMGNYPSAEQVFTAGHNLVPKNTQFLLYLARLEFASNRRGLAKDHLFAALKYDPQLANQLKEVAPELLPLLKEYLKP